MAKLYFISIALGCESVIWPHLISFQQPWNRIFFFFQAIFLMLQSFPIWCSILVILHHITINAAERLICLGRKEKQRKKTTLRQETIGSI
jgi:hypothetical protein